MELTKQIIEDKKFSGKRGKYESVEVDRFLAEVASGVDSLSKQNDTMRAEIEKYKAMESSLAQAMVTAENSAATILQDANTRASVIEKDATAEASTLVEEANARAAMIKEAAEEEAAEIRKGFEDEKKKLSEELAELRAFVATYKEAIKKDLDNFATRLDDMEAAKAWEERPEGVDDKEEMLDLNDILKDLPESDSELKAMIDELI